MPVDYAVKYGYSDIVAHYVANGWATNEALKSTSENKEGALVALGTEEAKLVYCGHSGWAIQTQNHFLIFDYWDRANRENPALVKIASLYKR